MKASQLSRASVNVDGWPLRQVYQHDDGRLLWDVDYLHGFFLEQDCIGRGTSKFLWLTRSFKADVEGSGLAAQDHLYLWKQNQLADELRAHLCTTLGLVHGLAQMLATCRSEIRQRACVKCLEAAVELSLSVIPLDELTVPLKDAQAGFRSGQVAGRPSQA
jgi:hypothetical protein